MVATRWVSQRLEQEVRAEEEAELYRLESGASAEDEDDVGFASSEVVIF